jgi:haloalkane dehalogenase
MKISRHFIRVGNRRVHYRRAGSGPSLLLLHQSPRSSAEYAALMQKWGEHFTCIAPDTPGYGQSDPLPGQPQIGDFAQAIVELMDALGIQTTAAYGFHSGGIMLVSAARRYPQRFRAIAVGGYAIWTEQERELFGARYLPPLRPSPYGEHLLWLWNRILEQSWFFPWFDVRNETRMSVAHDDALRVNAIVNEMLDSGDAYRTGYGAVLRAPRDIPGPDEPAVPALIAAYNGDPLQAHLARLGEIPPSWRAQAVATPADLEAACLAHLLSVPADPCPELRESRDGGFVQVTTEHFDGVLHWRGKPDATSVHLHAPGRSVELLDVADTLLLDLPGHGLSDDWLPGHSPNLDDWSAVVAQAIATLRAKTSSANWSLEIIGEGLSALLAADVARKLGAGNWGAIAAHIPLAADSNRWAELAIADLTPNRFGTHLTTAWSAVRAAHFFWPWFDVKAANAIPFAASEVTADALALEHRSLLRARAGRALLKLLLALDREALVKSAPAISTWQVAPWAQSRRDIWSPR